MSFLLKLLSMLPLPMLQRIARLVARILNAQDISQTTKGTRWIARVNGYIAYPDLTKAERDAFEKDTVENQCLSYIEFLKSWGNSPAYSINQIRDIHNQHLLTEALDNPNGMIAIVPHIGTWEMMNAWLNQFGSPTIMYKPVKDKAVNAFVLSGRQRLNANLVPTDASGIKAIFKSLKQGGFTIILPDHKPESEASGVYAPFFGVDTLSATIVGKLASKTQCALVGLSCIRRDDSAGSNDGFDVHCYAFDDPDLWSKDALIATTALNKAMERMINAHPTHYHWSYKRYRDSELPNSETNHPYEWSEQKLIENFVDNRLNTSFKDHNKQAIDRAER